MSICRMGLCVAAGILWPALAWAQNNENPGPFYWGAEVGVQSFALPGARQGIGNHMDSTNNREVDATYNFFFGKPTESDVLVDLLGQNQRLEFNWTHASADTREATSAPAVFAQFNGVGTVTFAGSQTLIDDYQYRSNEFGLKLAGKKQRDHGQLETYLGMGYQRVTQDDEVWTTGSSLIMYQHAMNSDIMSFFLGAEQSTPIQQGVTWVTGGELGLMYIDSRMTSRQLTATTARASSDDRQWSPRLRAHTGVVYHAPDGRSRIGITGRADYVADMPYIDGLDFVGDSAKISNAETLSLALTFDFTWWF